MAPRGEGGREGSKRFWGGSDEPGAEPEAHTARSRQAPRRATARTAGNSGSPSWKAPGRARPAKCGDAQCTRRPSGPGDGSCASGRSRDSPKRAGGGGVAVTLRGRGGCPTPDLNPLAGPWLPFPYRRHRPKAGRRRLRASVAERPRRYSLDRGHGGLPARDADRLEDKDPWRARPESRPGAPAGQGRAHTRPSCAQAPAPGREVTAQAQARARRRARRGRGGARRRSAVGVCGTGALAASAMGGVLPELRWLPAGVRRPEAPAALRSWPLDAASGRGRLGQLRRCHVSVGPTGAT